MTEQYGPEKVLVIINGTTMRPFKGVGEVNVGHGVADQTELKGFAVTFWKGTESERLLNVVMSEEEPVELSIGDSEIRALAIGSEDIEVNGKGAVRYTLETIKPKKPSGVKCVSCGHQWDNNDGSDVCPNAANHKDPGGAEMKPWIVRRDLIYILSEENDAIFEQRFRDWVGDNLFEPSGENPLGSYDTVDKLRETLDTYGVEPEDIIAAYRNEIEADREGRPKK
jgi:hypothetical protein